MEKFFLNHFECKTMTSKQENVLVMVDRAVCAGSVGRIFRMFGITLLSQTGLDESCTIQAKSRIKNAQGRKDLTWCSFF